MNDMIPKDETAVGFHGWLSLDALFRKGKKTTASLVVAAFTAAGMAYLSYRCVLKKLGMDSSPLFKAIKRWDTEAVRTLLQEKADTNDGGVELGRFPALSVALATFVELDDEATENGTPPPSDEILVLLMHTPGISFEVPEIRLGDVSMSPSEAVIEWPMNVGKYRAVEALLDNGYPVDWKPKRGYSALVWLCVDAKNENEDDPSLPDKMTLFTKALAVSKNVNAPIQELKRQTKTLMHIIAEHNDPHCLEIAQRLLDAGGWESLNARFEAPIETNPFPSDEERAGYPRGYEATFTQWQTRDAHHNLTPLEIAVYEGNNDMESLLAAAMLDHGMPLPTDEEYLRLKALRQKNGKSKATLISETKWRLTAPDGQILPAPQRLDEPLPLPSPT